MLTTDMSSSTFDPAVFLAHAGLGRRIVELEAKENFFNQGDQADFVLYLQDGRAKLTVGSQSGRGATVTLLSSGDLVGGSALAAIPGLRLSMVTALCKCTALKIAREEMIDVMHQEHAFLCALVPCGA